MDKKDEYMLARIEDACKKNYEPQFFDFFDEAAQIKIENLVKRAGEPYLFWGGTQNAARKMLCIYPDYVEESEIEWPIVASVFLKDFSLDHRNVLGELMHLGITRECIGDIYVGEDEVQIIFVERLQDFILMNLNKVKGRSVKLAFLKNDEIKEFEPKFKRMDLVAASDRLDGIINKIWGFSRQDSITYIKQRRVRVNYEEIIKNDYRIKSGDVIALRGKGKANIVEIGGQTKKGNLRLIVDKYI